MLANQIERNTAIDVARSRARGYPKVASINFTHLTV